MDDDVGVEIYDLRERLSHTPELRLIGRRIRLTFREFQFEGVVSIVCKQTVVLLDVDKFKLRSRRERRDRRNREDDFVCHYNCCTFVRRHISDVKLIETRPVPESVTRAVRAELTRAHLRRYIVHAILGTVPEEPLAFLQQRMGDKVLLDTDIEAMLELETQQVDLLATELSGDRIRMSRRAEEVVQVNVGPSAAPNQPIPSDDVDDDEMFSQNPSLRSVSTRMLQMAIGHLIVSIIVLLYAAAVFSTSSGAVSGPFVTSASSWIASAAASEFLHSAVVWLHSAHLKLPLSCKLFALRTVSFVLTFALLIIATYVTTSVAFFYVQPLAAYSARDEYVAEVRSNPQSICSYSVERKCSGWGAPCNATAWDASTCPGYCATTLQKYTAACAGQYRSDIWSVVIPVAVMQYICLLVYTADCYTAVRLLRVAYS